MKHVGVLALTLAAASAANADVILNLGSASLAAGQTTAQLPDLTGTLLSFSISYDFQPDAIAQANGSWASDAALAIQAPAGTPAQWGGYDALIVGGAAFVDYWIFDGGGSAIPGVYADNRADIPAGMAGTGTWAITFGNGWSGSTAVQYNDITVTLVGLDPVPAPSAAALLGLAGLGLARRRR